MDTILTIYNGSFTADIALDRLPDLPLASVRKLFKLALADYRNDEACMVLERNLEQAAASTKEALRVASQEYTDGLYPRTISREDKRHNKMLTDRLKAAKSAHTRATKVLTLYQSLK